MHMHNPTLEETEKAPAKKSASKEEKAALKSTEMPALKSSASHNQEGPVLDFFDAVSEVNGTRA